VSVAPSIVMREPGATLGTLVGALLPRMIIRPVLDRRQLPTLAAPGVRAMEA
jgi:hypothetical protein